MVFIELTFTDNNKTKIKHRHLYFNKVINFHQFYKAYNNCYFRRNYQD